MKLSLGRKHGLKQVTEPKSERSAGPAVVAAEAEQPLVSALSGERGLLVAGAAGPRPVLSVCPVHPAVCVLPAPGDAPAPPRPLPRVSPSCTRQARPRLPAGVVQPRPRGNVEPVKCGTVPTPLTGPAAPTPVPRRDSRHQTACASRAAPERQQVCPARPAVLPALTIRGSLASRTEPRRLKAVEVADASEGGAGVPSPCPRLTAGPAVKPDPHRPPPPPRRAGCRDRSATAAQQVVREWRGPPGRCGHFLGLLRAGRSGDGTATSFRPYRVSPFRCRVPSLCACSALTEERKRGAGPAICACALSARGEARARGPASATLCASWAGSRDVRVRSVVSPASCSPGTAVRSRSRSEK